MSGLADQGGRGGRASAAHAAAVTAGATARAHERLDEATAQLAILQARADRLQAVVEALAALLEEKTGTPRAELLARIEEAEARREARGGEASPLACAACGKVVSSRTLVCIYCGAQNYRTTLF